LHCHDLKILTDF